MLEKAVATQFLDQGSAGGIHVFMIDRQIRDRPRLDRPSECAMTLVKKRPAEECPVGHRSHLHSPCAGLTRASILPRHCMDCRVKPGNDDCGSVAMTICSQSPSNTGFCLAMKA